MPNVPLGQSRPADVIGNVLHIAKITTREEQEMRLKQPTRRNGGLAGARQDNTTQAQCSEIARKAANARWQ